MTICHDKTIGTKKILSRIHEVNAVYIAGCFDLYFKQKNIFTFIVLYEQILTDPEVFSMKKFVILYSDHFYFFRKLLPTSLNLWEFLCIL